MTSHGEEDITAQGKAHVLSVIIGIGITGRIELLPSRDRVKKSPHPLADDYDKRWMRKHMAREVRAYERLPKTHERFIRMISYSASSDDCNIVFEYLPNGDVREFLEEHPQPMQQRLQWAMDAAEAVQLAHEHGIIHSDIKPPNLLVDEGLRLRLIDFSGSSIDNEPALVVENSRFFLPRSRRHDPSTVVTDLFALGSTIYEIITGKQPFDSLEEDEVERRYALGEFPPVEGIVCGHVIKMCWECKFDTAQAVFDTLVIEVGNLY